MSQPVPKVQCKCRHGYPSELLASPAGVAQAVCRRPGKVVLPLVRADIAVSCADHQMKTVSCTLSAVVYQDELALCSSTRTDVKSSQSDKCWQGCGETNPLVLVEM